MGLVAAPASAKTPGKHSCVPDAFHFEGEGKKDSRQQLKLLRKKKKKNTLWITAPSRKHAEEFGWVQEGTRKDVVKHSFNVNFQ